MPTPLPPGTTAVAGTVTTGSTLGGSNSVSVPTIDNSRTITSGENSLTVVGVPGEAPPLEAAPSPVNPAIDIWHPDYVSTLPVVLPGPFVLLDLPVLAGALTINGTDYSDEHARTLAQHGLAQVSEGTIELFQVGRDINPEYNSDFETGNLVSLSVNVLGVDEDIFRNYVIVEEPRWVPSGKYGGGTLTLVVGDDFVDARRLQPFRSEPYCGPQPATAGEAAALEMQLKGKTMAFPTGVDIYERVQDREGEDSFAKISEMFAASGQVLYTTAQNNVAVNNFPQFNNTQAVDVYVEDLLEAPVYNYEGRVGFSEVLVRARTIRPVALTTVRLPQDFVPIEGYNANDFTPAVFGGRNQYDVRNRRRIGKELDWEKRVRYGRFPTAAFVNREDAYNASSASNCSVGGQPANGNIVWDASNTAFGIIWTFQFQLEREPHCSGKQRITARKRATEGFTFVGEADNMVRYPAAGTAPLSQELEELFSQQYPDPAVCECDYSWLLRQKVNRVWEVIDTNLGMQLVSSDRDLHQIARENRDIAIGEAVGSSTDWTKTVYRSRLDRETGIWDSPLPILTYELPPNAPWIDVPLETIDIPGYRVRNRFIEAEIGEARPSQPVDAPYVSTPEQARQFGDMWLRREAGAFKQVSISLSPTKILRMRESVRFWNAERTAWRPYVVTDKDPVLENGGLRYGYLLARAYPDL